VTRQGQHRYGADADWDVLDWVHNAHWRHLANMLKLSVCGGNGLFYGRPM